MLALSMTACGESMQVPTEDPGIPQPLWAQNTETGDMEPDAPETGPVQQDIPLQETEAVEETTAATVEEIPGELPEETEQVAQTEEVVPETEAAAYPMEEKFTPVNETVYAKKAVNIRSQGNIDSAILGKLKKGESVLRVGTSEDGWSAIYHKDTVCYVASEYLTAQEVSPEAENPNLPTEQEVDDVVYTVDDVNMREGPGFDKAVLCRVPEFVELHRTAIVSSGWSKVTYKDKEGYISTGYLAEKHPGQTEEQPQEEAVEETVYTTREVNLRKGPGTNKAILGRIPEGTELVRTAVTEDGWSKVTYNGEPGYVSGDYLTTDAPEAQEEE